MIRLRLFMQFSFQEIRHKFKSSMVGVLPMISPSKQVNDEALLLSKDDIKEREDTLRRELQSYRAARMEANEARSDFAENRSKAKQEIYDALNTISAEQYSNDKAIYDALNVIWMPNTGRILSLHACRAIRAAR